MIRKNKMREVRETNLGVYVWQLPNGEYLVDAELNVLSITSMRNDLVAMSRIREAARNFGYPEGQPIFAEGARKISEDEHQEQMGRILNGEAADPYDIKLFKEGLNKKNGS
jgi:hypothetical protein